MAVIIMSKNREKYFLCPVCENLETKTGLLKTASSGGLGMCYCQYENDRQLISYVEISKKEYESRLKQKFKT